ncbi:MAG: hypothetical protein ACKVS8_05255 [Phycisphaerales bacterium]
MDTLELYRWAVQDPDTHAAVLGAMYESVRPRLRPVVLREDFAGTSAESVAWVALKPRHRAVAVDLDGATLDWARRRAARLLGPRAADVQFVQGDCLAVGPPAVPAADIISVLNFSILYLREADVLAAYLRSALANLAPGGVLVFNVFGGPLATTVGTTRHAVEPNPRSAAETAIPPFHYGWEVRSFDAASGLIDCRIHFEIDDAAAPGGVNHLRDAFTYDWRLRSVAELTDACRRAGFSSVQVWRHTYDASKGAKGVFLGRIEPRTLEALDTWTAYIVACR